MKRALCGLIFASGMYAQGLDPATLLKPPTDAWPTYNGDYSGRRFSPLKQINTENVGSLTLAWAYQTKASALKSTPLEVNGVLYFTVPDNVWAIDARSGREIWRYTYKQNDGDHIGHRGVGMYGNWLYFETPDCHLISLNAKDGSVRWDIELADPKLGYFATMAPLVIKNHVLVGVSGDVTDIPGFVESIDPESGKVQWKWNTEPKKGEPGAETWPLTGDAIEHGGGMTWMTGTYDPGSNLTYWGIGNPNPVLAGDGRSGDNLYTCSIVALDADTGKFKWYFQPSPHDVHDWDAVQTPVVFDGDFHGAPRKLIAQASRNGFFFLLDRVTGEHLVTSPFIETNWTDGIDKRGRPIAKLDKYPAANGSLVSPGSNGATNWMSPTFDNDTGLFYVSARRMFSIFYLTAVGKAEGWGGRDRNLWAESALQAIYYQTGKIAWTHELGPGEDVAGLMTTAGGLLFTADTSGNLIALDAKTGKTLWHSYGGGAMVSSPSTYMLDGRQYVLTGVQGVLFAWALPEIKTRP
jgi:acido-empty-quinoprotein group A